MMILEYDREWAQCGRRKIECLLRTLSRRMGEGGGVSSLPGGATRSLLPVKFPAAPVLLADGPQLGSWQVAVVRVDETPAGDVPGRKSPRAGKNRQRPIDLSQFDGDVRPVLVGLQSINQSINLFQFASFYTVLYIYIIIFKIQFDTNWGCAKDQQYLSGGTTHK